MLTLRPYQEAAARAATAFLEKPDEGGGLVVVPTGGGKSVIVAAVAHRLAKPILVFCPSKEILAQNYEKMQRIEPGLSALYSASVGQKNIALVTFATIGSVMRHAADFDVFRHIIVDEAHGVNAQGGQYEAFIHRRKDRRVVGFTATPYRLAQSYDGGSILKFLTRTRPRIFTQLLYHCQVSDLLEQGFLAPINYYDLTAIDLQRVRSNTTGSDYDADSLVEEYQRSGFYEKLLTTTLRVLHPKDGTRRNGILVFTRFTREAQLLVDGLAAEGVSAAIVTGETPKRERERIIENFRAGKIRVVANAMVLATGFDYPELDTVILARPTKSLALYYQMIGRAIRPSQGKRAWAIDLCGTYRRFGSIADLTLATEREGTQRWAVFSRGRQLTNITFN